ncbi:hypothetical protein FFLO_02165 [Filobasidium floriforme]|uniref:Alpha-1,4 glucan phosphorylase n=1 Tax=Filobasidium floriforme TaxID=5210 RepID=A0A8K0NS27_9TREE|nr:uncharacterized protein HD553DRAFT_306454 [Filobasidium floriforme]KAG7562385.1 hypothetical protein FFLO_02165 [Filobasidium floriforme]KAH8088442.1 hypothetical protein HD553DRAFT_306454 [Filobasidium floriforme]
MALRPQHTGDSIRSERSFHSSHGHQTPVLSRKSSIANTKINTAQIGVPLPKEAGDSDGFGARPRMHKRSLTGNYDPSQGAEPETKWPIGDEKTWKDALKADEEKDVKSIAAHVVHHVSTTLARQPFNANDSVAYQACALAIRDELIRRWNTTTSYHTKVAPKRAYYFSLEYLMGRTLDNAVLNLDMKDMVAETMGKLGFNFEDLLDEERDAGLGNGGLGRLAACYLDSATTLDLPVWGYGLRYDYGIFKQLIDENGRQVEAPDPWLAEPNPFEIPRNDIRYPVRFFGQVEKQGDRCYWWGGQEVQAMAYDVPIPGWKTKNVNNIRLWSAKPITGFDLQSFNAGDYERAVAASQSAETITRVLYPNDNTTAGKELRLKQQYLWCCASLQDILRRYKKLDLPWSQLPTMISIQCNDTHPIIAIPELQRVLVDEEHLPFDEAWEIVKACFFYTNHTVLPEALETWPVPLMEHLLPRHMQIIYDINWSFLQAVAKKFPGDQDRLGRMSLIEESQPRRVRMGYLAVVGTTKVNGVAALHSGLVRSVLFKDFVEFYGPSKFTNVTNGITPRRFLHQANPELSSLITSCIGTDEWLKDLSLIGKFEPFVENPQVRKSFQAIKESNKLRLAELVEKELGIALDPTALFTVQAKRFHEYKRQTLNVFGCIHRYLKIKAMTPSERKKVTPHVAFFAGKAAPGYAMAKLMIQLINNVGRVVNNDREVGDLFKVVMLADYSVSLAEVLMPAADLSVQISTAGTEASGTGNMKLSINGALMLGTVDGANVEIAEEVDEEQCFLFGHLTPDVDHVRYLNEYQAMPLQERCAELAKVFDAIKGGMFGNGNGDNYTSLLYTVEHVDHYLVANDFESYLRAEALADDLFTNNHEEWVRRAMLTTARMGKFSSDRAVAEYAEELWNIEPARVPEH